MKGDGLLRRRAALLMLASGTLLSLSSHALPAGAVAQPISYSGKITDSAGTPRDVAFRGTVDGSSFRGSAETEGNTLRVTGTVGSDGSIPGTVALSNGEP